LEQEVEAGGTGLFFAPPQGATRNPAPQAWATRGGTGLRFTKMERDAGIEPAALAWEARVLPLYESRDGYGVYVIAAAPGQAAGG
jgi:hypothetical protein